MSQGKRIFGAFAVAAALFFLWPVVVGGWAKTGALRDAVTAREALLQQRLEVLANARSAYEEYTNRLSQSDGQKFAALVPVRKDAAEIISAMQSIATDTGMQLQEIRPAETKAGGDDQFQTLSVTMELSGSYASLKQFLTSVEQYVRLLNVQSITAATDQTDASRMRFTIRADAYYIR